MAISKDKILSEVEDTAMIIKLAIKAIQKFPPKDLTTFQLDLIIKGYTKFGEEVAIASAHSKYKDIKQIKHFALTYFQEGHGTAVNHFWSELKSANIQIERIDKLNKLLKRNKISSQMEYDYIVDAIVPLQQENLITPEQAIKLSDMIGKFEQRK